MSTRAPQSPVMAAYARLVEQRYALRVTERQIEELAGQVGQLLAQTTAAGPSELYAALAAGLHPQLLQQLAASLTIGETHFFRVTPQIAGLRDVILPDIVSRHAADRRVRAWSAGCSTGEEAHTLAILIREGLARPRGWTVQLLATDINQAALEVAARGVYGEWSFRETPAAVRQRYFSRAGKQWQLVDAVRRMVHFAYLNLADDPLSLPPAARGPGFDLIVCRNVTIYFGPEATQRLYRQLAQALAPAGWLVLGPSDPPPAPTAGLAPTFLSGAVVWRASSAAAPVVALGRAPVRQQVAPAPRSPRLAPATGGASAATRSDGNGQVAEYLQAGMVHLDAGAIDAAIDSLRRATFLDESNVLAQFSLGCAYRQGGHPARARAAFVQARRLLVGVPDDKLVADGAVAAGGLRNAVEAQLGDRPVSP